METHQYIEYDIYSDWHYNTFHSVPVGGGVSGPLLWYTHSQEGRPNVLKHKTKHLFHPHTQLCFSYSNTLMLIIRFPLFITSSIPNLSLTSLLCSDFKLVVSIPSINKLPSTTQIRRYESNEADTHCMNAPNYSTIKKNVGWSYLMLKQIE